LCRDAQSVQEEFDGRAEQLRVDSASHVMYRLRTTQSPGYRFRVSMQQFQWAGGPGVFFALHRIEKPDCGDAYAYQTIELRPHPADREYFLVWSQWEVCCHDNGLISRTSHQVAESRIPPPRMGVEQTLEIATGVRGLESVRWEGQPIPEMNHKAASKLPVPVDASVKGDLGLFNRAGSTVFRDARLMPQL
jgi:hypothetical protein